MEETISEIVERIEIASKEETKVFITNIITNEQEEKPDWKNSIIQSDLTKIIKYYIKKFGFSFFFGALTEAVFDLDKKDLHKEKPISIYTR